MPQRLNPTSGKGYRFKDRAGQRNGRLLFTRPLGRNKHNHHIWEAQCDCGKITATATPHVTRSCGCLHREVAAETQRAKALLPAVKIANRKAAAARQRARRKENPLAVMQARLSRLHRHALLQVGAIKTSPTFEQLGYSAEVFVAHIERQFLPRMGWHNMPEWQIDHIIPVAQAKTEADVIALNQLSNLRPMWAPENNAKKARRTHLL
jgi:hypothetical protein